MRGRAVLRPSIGGMEGSFRGPGIVQLEPSCASWLSYQKGGEHDRIQFISP